MKNFRRYARKSYAMKRMAAAIDRAIRAISPVDKERSARWAAAWGLLCGINTNAVRLRTSEVQEPPAPVNRRRASDRQPEAAVASDQIVIPPAEAPALPLAADGGALTMGALADPAEGGLAHGAASIFVPPAEAETAAPLAPADNGA